MRNIIFQALAEAARGSEPVALGIITGVQGSSPQKVGAKALFYADGRIKGTLGGGCLEAEIQQRAVQSLHTGLAARFDLLLDHDFGWDDGLMCGGKVCGLILPSAQKAGAEFWGELAERTQTMTWGVKSDYAITRIPDSGALDTLQGFGVRQSSGTLSVADEADTIQKRQRTGALQDAGAPSVDGGAAGTPRPTGDWLYQETVMAPCALWIAGAGHVAQAVAPLAAQLDFSVTVFDDRPALANHQFFPRDVTLQADIWEKLLALPLPATPAFGLIVTRGHRHDGLVLKEWIHQPFVFLGMIGSARKARTMIEHFTEEKLATPEELQRVACPVGVKIRSQSPQEIAVSIIAQFIDKRAELVYGRTV
jgi:xanthine dehydrogenase accessory factor